MDKQFELPVEYNGKEYIFPVSFFITGFIHKFIFGVNGQEIRLKEFGINKNPDPGLLKVITDVIEGWLNTFP